MVEVVNLRTARKRAQRREDEQRANANRLSHGRPTHQRKFADAQQSKAKRDLDHHRVETGDGR